MPTSQPQGDQEVRAFHVLEAGSRGPHDLGALVCATASLAETALPSGFPPSPRIPEVTAHFTAEHSRSSGPRFPHWDARRTPRQALHKPHGECCGAVVNLAMPGSSSKWNHSMSFCVWPISLSRTSSRFIMLSCQNFLPCLG